jgi:hypothetical protein
MPELVGDGPLPAHCRNREVRSGIHLTPCVTAVRCELRAVATSSTSRNFPYAFARKPETSLTTLPPLTQASIIAEVRPERNLAGAFSFLASGGNGATHRQISRANQRMRPMIRISSAVRS